MKFSCAAAANASWSFFFLLHDAGMTACTPQTSLPPTLAKL
jgi:hypothetical protein